MASSVTTNKRHPGIMIGVVLWTTLILGLYYWVHKPVNPPLARAVGGAFLDLLIALCVVAVSAGLGRRVLRWLALEEWSVPERSAASAVVGLGILGPIILVVGAVALTRWSMLGLLVVLVGAVFREIVLWCGELVAFIRQGLPARGFERLLAIIVVIMLVMALIIATLPPTKFDVLTYHLAGPEQYVEHGRFYAVAHNHFLGFPQGMETLYAAQLAITGQLTGGGVLHWWIGVLLLMLAGGFGARKSNTLAGWGTVGGLLVALSVWMEMTFAYTDLLPMALMAVGLCIAEQWAHKITQQLPHIGSRYALFMGAVAGMGMSVKYSVLWLAVALGILVLWLHRARWQQALVYGLIFGLAALAVLTPWLIRNMIWYSNPVYPLVFDAGEMDSIRQDWYSQPESGLLYGDSAWQIPILPLTATFFGLEGGGIFGATIGPLFLILVPMIFLVRPYLDAGERQTVQVLTLTSGIVWLAWTASSAFGSYISLQTRLVFYMLVPLAILVGIVLAGLRRLPKKPIDVGFVVQAMVAFTLILTVVEAGRFLLGSGVETYYSGEDDYRTEFLQNELGWHYETMRQLNTTLPQDAAVWFLWEPRYLYCDSDRIQCRTDSLMDAWYYARRRVHDPTQIAEQWRGEGAEYLLVYEFGRRLEAGEEGENNEGNTLYDPEDWTAWHNFVETYLSAEWQGEDSDGDPVYILYRWQE